MPVTMPVLVNVPQVSGGYPLDGEWYVVVPIARINEVTNPSGETNTTGYTAGSGSLSRATTRQFHGAYSFTYVPAAATTDGFFYGNIATTAAQYRAISCKFLGQPNIPYALTFATTAGVDLVKYEFRATGRWQWIWLYYLETSSTNRRIYFRKNGSADTHTFYVDGVQSEVINTGEFVSTYIDGDQLGFLPNQSPYPYGWNGTPHASTSFRLGTTRAGGYVIPFAKYGFIMMSIVGLGLPTPQNISTEYASIDGGYPSYTRKPTGQFTVVGNFSGPTALQLRTKRSQLGRLFDRDVAPIDQTLLLQYHHTDNCLNTLSDNVAIPCKYVSGLDGNYDNSFGQTAPLTFETYIPNITSEAESGVSLTVQQSLATANLLIKRSFAGQWSILGTGITGVRIYSLLVARSGRIYIGGDFTSLGGVASTQGIGYFDPSDNAFHAMGTGIATLGQVAYCLVEAADGSIYAGGDFLLMGGVANTVRIAKYTPGTNTWSALSTGANGGVFGMAIAPTGLLYVGGSFTTIGGVGATRAAKWNGAAFSAMATVGATPTAVVVGPDDKIYYGGSFTAPFNQVTAWNPTTLAFEGLSTGPGGTISTLAFTPNGLLYAGGDATSGYLKVWNGTYWSTVIGGMGGTFGLNAILSIGDGTLYLGGSGTTYSQLPNLSDSLVRLFPGIQGGSVVIPVGVDLPGTAGLYAFAKATNGDVYFGYDTTGTATIEGVTTVTNNGTAWAFPTVVFRGPSSGTATVDHLTNYTTGKSLSLNLTLQAGETAVLTLTPDSISFVSDVQGNIASAILPGSNETSFFLLPGTNSIGTFSSSSTTTVVMYWNTPFLSLDDLT